MNLEAEQRIDEYILIEKLSEYSHVWQAFDDNSQREVVLKFIEDRASADREGIVLSDMDHPNILKLLRRFDYQNTPVLVFEYVQGLRLDKAIRNGLTRDESFKVCTDIISALKSVHQFGLFHGDLSPFNVIWSATKNKAYLIDFGALGGCTVLSATPEHDPESRIPLGPYTDIVGFGRILMSMFPKMKSLYERCLQNSPDLRPSAEEILKTLVKARDKGKMVLKGSILTGITLLLGWISVAVGINGRSFGPDQMIQELSGRTTYEDRETLRNFLVDPSFAEYHSRIVKSIAGMNVRLGEKSILIPDFTKIVAVFALRDNPMVVLDSRILQLGDYIRIGSEENGYVSEINKGNIIVKTSSGSKSFHYDIPVVVGRRTYEFKPISIFPGRFESGKSEHRFNLRKIAQAVCTITGRKLLGDPGPGVISGGFDAETYEDFLVFHGDLFYFDEFHVRVNNTQMPISIIGKEDFWSQQDIVLGDILRLYEPATGYRCIYKGSEKREMEYPVYQFLELIEVMELEFVVNDEEILIFDKGGNND